jgi:hypothetical protein
MRLPVVLSAGHVSDIVRNGGSSQGVAGSLPAGDIDQMSLSCCACHDVMISQNNQWQIAAVDGCSPELSLWKLPFHRSHLALLCQQLQWLAMTGQLHAQRLLVVWDGQCG